MLSIYTVRKLNDNVSFFSFSIQSSGVRLATDINNETGRQEEHTWCPCESTLLAKKHDPETNMLSIMVTFNNVADSVAAMS